MSDDGVKGKVARIVSDREVILNRGLDDGVEVGATFYIFDANTVDVADPDTGENLGGVRRVKALVRAIDVAPRLTLARTFRTRKVNTGGTGTFGTLLASPKWETKVETLRIDPQAGKPIADDEAVVAQGDPFEQTFDDDLDTAPSVALWESL
ncbi:hypothetical protein [Demequina sp. NBRC 110052]|uniref:hypothetical protein n=1 Tax=Demequina sp. NBRC 110052 TaxID=1570341 RepID=UPI000A0141D8|nr:hypothetical protein [Demequina sp. NBRC 110052]